MSRIGKSPITLPTGVEAKVQGSRVEVKVPKGTLHQGIDPPSPISVDYGGGGPARADEEHQREERHSFGRALS